MSGSGRRGEARAGDVRIVFERWGAGPPLVVCHAFGVDRTMWLHHVDAFTPTHEVIAFDQRGCGESDHPGPGAPDAYTIDGFADDLRAVLDAIGVERARILGESMGGATALRFALRWPERVEALILVSTMASRLPEAIIARAREVERVLETQGLREAVRFYFRGPLLSGVPRGPVWDALVDMWADRATPHGFLGTYRVTIDRPSLAVDLHRITAPTLILVGERDTHYLPDAELLSKGIPGARKVVLPGVGHSINAEAPGDFNREVLAFLRILPERLALGDGL